MGSEHPGRVCTEPSGKNFPSLDPNKIAPAKLPIHLLSEQVLIQQNQKTPFRNQPPLPLPRTCDWINKTS